MLSPAASFDALTDGHMISAPPAVNTPAHKDMRAYMFADDSRAFPVRSDSVQRDTLSLSYTCSQSSKHACAQPPFFIAKNCETGH